MTKHPPFTHRKENVIVLQEYLKKQKTYFKANTSTKEKIGLSQGKLVDAIRILKKEGILEPYKVSHKRIYIIHKERIKE
jgi:hypothetical protein